LLGRGKNTVSLTAADELFYEEVRDVLARSDQAIRSVRGQTRGEALRLGYVPSLNGRHSPRAIERFHAMTTRVRLELSDLNPLAMSDMPLPGASMSQPSPRFVQGLTLQPKRTAERIDSKGWQIDRD
jgi:hypothetical protein